MLILQDGGLRNESEKEKMGRGFFFFYHQPRRFLETTILKLL
jgi:hypothetical protein